MATVIGIGDVADRQVPLDTCAATVRRALDAGLNLIDTAPCYENGYSEEIVGAALRGRRDGVFVIDKVDALDQPVGPQVEASLRRLGLSHADLFVFHGVSRLEDWRALAAAGGGMAQLATEVARGRARFRGVSSHHPDVLRAAIESGLCDVAMFPVSACGDPRYAEEILPLARRRDVGTVGFKCFGAGKLLGDTAGYNQPLAARPRGKVSSGGDPAAAGPLLPHLSVQECIDYTLTCEPDVALLGMSFPNEQDAAFAAVRAFRRLDAAALADLRARAAEALRDKGAVWWNPPG
jgi:aryl-alcohol dehydrogenase-like predicted oxidoreductase